MNNQIGAGQYGCVYTAYRKDFGLNKIVCKIQQQNKNQINEEISIIKEVNGAYIAEVLDVYKTSSNIYIFMKYYQKGDLQHYLQQNRQYLSEKDILTIFYKIVYGYFQNIYNRQIIHRDIKASNILMDEVDPYITDFGQSIRFQDLQKEQSPYFKGTPFYQSPQMQRQEGTIYSYQTDIYSLGILLYYMLYSQYPNNSRQLSDYQMFIQKLKNEGSLHAIKFPKTKNNVNVSLETKNLILQMITYDENDRIEIIELINHKVFLEIKENINQYGHIRLQQQNILKLENQTINYSRSESISGDASNDIQKTVLYYQFILELSQEILNHIIYIGQLHETITQVLGIQEYDLDIFTLLVAQFLYASLFCCQRLVQNSHKQIPNVPFHKYFYSSKYKTQLEKQLEQSFKSSSILLNDLKKEMTKYLPNQETNMQNKQAENVNSTEVNSQTKYLEQLLNYSKNNTGYLFDELKNIFVEKIITNSLIILIQENDFSFQEDLWIFLNFFVCLFDGTINISKYRNISIAKFFQDIKCTIDEQFRENVMQKLSIIKYLSQGSNLNIPNSVIDYF
ncbi:hypothetical protein ABPG74_015908 [Tetrahymena malaccensis]